jgi:ABC-type bacteriocin/lantibiotic exporter with double-glycine peptidase domain
LNVTKHKVLKLYAWEPSFMGFVAQIRAQEIKILKQIAIVSSLGSFIMVFAPFLVSLASYAFYVNVLNRPLTATIIFVSMTLFNLLRFPLSMLPTVISAVVQLQVSQKRLDTFLNAEELDPDGITRLPRVPTADQEKGSKGKTPRYYIIMKHLLPRKDGS